MTKSAVNDTNERPRPEFKNLLGDPARWIAAVICFTYGFAKLNGSQFTVLDSEIARPMGEVSGFWLTWYYFGFSPAYGTLIALVQIGGGLLLTLPRTAVAGALVLLPVVVNIVLTDIFFGIGALPMSVLLLACLLVVVLPQTRQLAAAVFAVRRPARSAAFARGLIVLALLSGAWGFTYWLANYNNRVPTPIDGVWAVEDSTRSLRHVFFEYNRAHMAVFRSRDGSDNVHHFEVTPDGQIQVWTRHLQKGPLVYSGLSLDQNRIELWAAGTLGDTLVLRRER